MAPEVLRRKAEELAHALNITLYLRDGRIWQHGPGERIDPPKGAGPGTHGQFEIAAAERL